MYDDKNSAGQWEVVGGGGKGSTKTKGKTQSNKANGSKSGPMPQLIKVDELVTPLDTKYALLDPELRAQAKREALGVPEKQSQKAKATKVTSTNPTKEVAKKKPAAKESTKENKPPKVLHEAIKQLNVTELSAAMTTVKARFSGSALLWLKELTTYLNNNLSNESDPVFAGKPREYPTSLLSSELKNIISSTIQSCDVEVLNTFYNQSLITLPSDMNRGAGVCGTKIVLQMMSFHKPELVLSHLERAREVLETNESRVPVALSVLWILSQSFKDPRVGVKVWKSTMLPLINMKNYGPFVGQSADYLATKLSNVKLSPNDFSVADYYNLVDQLQQEASLSANIRREATNLVQALAGPVIKAHGSKMFVPSLRRLVSDSSNRAEINRILTTCLETDAHSYDIWRKEYRSSLVASGYLLQYIADNKSVAVRYSEEFKATLHHFQTVNSTFSPTSKVPLGLNHCVQLCDSLMRTKTKQKTKRSKSNTLKYLNYILLIALVSVVYYDIGVNGNGQFANSRLGKASERFGVTAKVLELHQRARPYLDPVEERLVQLRDVAYVKGGEVYQQAQPYLKQVGDKLVHLRDVVYVKSEELYPGIWAEVDKKYQLVLSVAKEQSAAAYVKAGQYAEIGIEASAKYWDKFLDWSVVYRKQLVDYGEKAVEVSGAYLQRARQITIELIEKEQVQYAIKYTYDMYHKALHAIGLCSH